MNFYEEFEREMKNANLKGAKIIPVPEELRPTSEDFAKLEKSIAIKVRENEIMLEESLQNAKNSLI